MATTLSKRRIEAAPGLPVAGQVLDDLRERILSLALVPGTVINRADLQKRYDASSTPIRDALMRLAEAGLVDVVPQSATRVSLIDVEHAKQTQFLRRSLELEVVETLCRSSDKSVVPVLRELLERQREASRRGDFAAFERLDLLFHRRMYEAAAVANLYDLVRQRSGHIDRLRRLHLPLAGRMQEILRDHTQIMKAIAAADEKAGRRHAREHLSRSLAYSPLLREKHPDYFKP